MCETTRIISVLQDRVVKTVRARTRHVANEYHYWDDHCENVMRDDNDNYRLIDLEGFVLY